MDQAWRVGALRRSELKFLLFDGSQKQKNMLAANNESGLKDKTNRGPKTKIDAIKMLPS